MANIQKVLAKKGNYYAVAESTWYALYMGCKIKGQFETQFITSFSNLEDFEYEVDKAEEEIAYLLEEVTL
jgi:hypothetical protein